MRRLRELASGHRRLEVTGRNFTICPGFCASFKVRKDFATSERDAPAEKWEHGRDRVRKRRAAVNQRRSPPRRGRETRLGKGAGMLHWTGPAAHPPCEERLFPRVHAGASTRSAENAEWKFVWLLR